MQSIVDALRAKPAWKAVGRFAALGLTEPWQTALIVPESYSDFTKPQYAAESHDPKKPLLLTIAGPIKNGYTSRSAPKTTVPCVDAGGSPIKAVFIGEHPENQARIDACRTQDDGLWLLGDLSPWGGNFTMLVKDILDPEWIGKIRPNYPGKRVVLPPELVRAKVTAKLHAAIPVAAAWIEEQLASLVSPCDLAGAAGCPGWTLDQILMEMHLPTSIDMGEAARRAVLRIAALGSMAKAHQHVVKRPDSRPIHCPPLETLTKGLPWPLTPSQKKAAEDICADLGQSKAMRRVLIGDVGSGKTAAFGIAVAGAVRAGARVAVLLPNMPLAEQVFREIRGYWPDTHPVLVTGASDTPSDDHRLWVGTTAILHRATRPFDFVVVDEEQKFATHQRTVLSGATGHLLTSSATCIPRSQALAKYGAVSVSILENGHAKKDITTTLWLPEDRRNLFAEIREYLASGDPLLVVYPTKAPGTVLPPDLSVEHAAGRWEPLAPGRVRVLDGDAKDEVKSAVIADMKEGRADILISTTVVEVGLTIPKLRRIILIAPERLGLTTIHQLRGRVARLGGRGWCDLYAANGLKPKQKERLDRFLNCKTGFEVAELDLAIRGFGDLSIAGTKQSGADDDFVFGQSPGPEHLTAMEELWTEICTGGATGSR